jgi:hypothetical protein
MFSLVRGIEPQVDRPGGLSRPALAGSQVIIWFFERGNVNPLGSFHDLDGEKRPTLPSCSPADKRPVLSSQSQELFLHSYSIAYLTGRPGADTNIDHEMNFLWNSQLEPEGDATRARDVSGFGCGRPFVRHLNAVSLLSPEDT